MTFPPAPPAPHFSPSPLAELVTIVSPLLIWSSAVFSQARAQLYFSILPSGKVGAALLLRLHLWSRAHEACFYFFLAKVP